MNTSFRRVDSNGRSKLSLPVNVGPRYSSEVCEFICLVSARPSRWIRGLEMPPTGATTNVNQERPQLCVSVMTLNLVLRTFELPSSSHRRVLKPFLLHPARPTPGTSSPHEDAQTPYDACAAPPPPPPDRFSTHSSCSRHIVLRAPPALRRYTRRK